MDVANKVVLLSGGAGGLGRALASLLLSRGGAVFLCDRAGPGLETVKADLGADYGSDRVGGAELDVRSAEEWETAWKVQDSFVLRDF